MLAEVLYRKDALPWVSNVIAEDLVLQHDIDEPTLLEDALVHRKMPVVGPDINEWDFQGARISCVKIKDIFKVD